MNPDKLDALVTANPAADAAGILALCAADSRTIRPILLSDLNPWLGKKGRFARIEDMPNYIQDAAQKVQVSVGVRSALNYFNSPANSQFDLTDAENAADADGLISTAKQVYSGSGGAAGLSDDECTELLGFGGGYAVKDATADDVAASVARVAVAKEAADRRVAIESLNQLRFAADDARSQKITWLMDAKNSATAVPTDLASLDAFTIPAGN